MKFFKTVSLIVIVFGLFISMSLTAQHKCLSSDIRNQHSQNPHIAQNIVNNEAYIQRWIAENPQMNQRELVTIPVVVHVLYANATQNINDAQILSQIAVLNADFRKLNSNFSNTPAQFQGLGADIEVEFCMATVDAQGNTTTGITRKSVAANFDLENDYFVAANGGITEWDTSKYLNVWIGDFGTSGTLGFATFPNSTNGGGDGSVIDYRAWGNTGAVTSPSDGGRTATHEIGHYLGLEHVWGPNSGGCNEDDGVSDTPLQFTESTDCPTFPLLDNCTTSGDGIMFMNYMDYVDDNCMTMFSAGQKARMRAVLDGPRASLKTSTGCAGSASARQILQTPVILSPNPAQSFFMLEAETDEDLQIQVLNITGQVLYSTSMNGNQNQIRIATDGMATGLYFVRISNGKLNKTLKVIVNE